MKKPIILLALLPFLAVSCLDSVSEEAVPALSPDVEEVFALADVFSGDTDSTKVVRITSNRSWSAHLNDVDNPIDESDPTQSVSWGYLSVEAHPNLSNSTETFDLIVVFHRNFEKKQINGVLNIYSEGKKAASVKLTQAPVKYHLNVTTDISNVGENGETVPVKVDCNTAWTVKVDKSTTADLAYINPKGYDPTVLGVNFLANEEKTSKTAKLTFSAEDCEDVSIEFTQDPSTSELNVFEIFTTFATSGTGTAAVPTVKLDYERMYEKFPELKEAKPKFYFTSTTEAGVEPDTPTAKSSAVPAEGWDFIPVKPLATNNLTIFIFAKAEGYRDCYSKVYVRDWTIGKNHTKAAGNGLIISNEAKLSVSDDYATCAADSYFSSIALEGGHAQIFLKAHNASNKPVGIFGVGETEASRFEFDAKYTNTSPTTIVSSTFDCSINDELRFTSSGAKTFIWDFAVMEMKKVKM